MGYNSTLVSYFHSLEGGRKAGPWKKPPTETNVIEANYPYLKTEVPGLKLHFLPNEGRGKFFERSIYAYIRQHAKEIEILNLFHFSSENIFYAIVYKFFHPHGKIYLKLDIDIDFHKNQASIFNSAGILGKVKSWGYQQMLLPLFFRMVKLISAESIDGYHYFKDRYRVPEKKMAMIPNGADLDRLFALTKGVKSFVEKENILLSVGRIGDAQKNNELLLEAIPKLSAPNWKFYFVGPIEPEFKGYINKYFENYPHLKDQVIFTGNISDPAQLYGIYNRSKLFCLSSLWEGFPLAAVEAACYGNVLVLHNKIKAFGTLTDHGKNGLSFNQDNITEVLAAILSDDELQQKMHQNALIYSHEQFSWHNSVKKIDTILNF
ncbi:glycosyltransferase [Pedobacter sp. ISL-68]|uniref:glycosyltransferase family 4 protein n=1 Tax=unclassified Pedobacter TaxID=2628915 RepID=UPI001BE62A99|nr:MULTISPECIES: glycosyltransferase [unclassified Pedobacter]MBT2562807.1 glycosyltransferase [Pedobacter sp. ISL-64]MBT2593320.1 glycosyltransferase [Pedobacter sp. ISL-68]